MAHNGTFHPAEGAGRTAAAPSASPDTNLPHPDAVHHQRTANSPSILEQQLQAPVLAAGEKLTCVSYAPFRGPQDPLVEGTRVTAEQIDEDLALLAKYTGCIRTYSVDDGRDDVLKSARRYGLKVLHGVWVSGDPDRTHRQIATSTSLSARRM